MGLLGVERSRRAVGRVPGGVADRGAVLCDRWADPRAAVVGDRRTLAREGAPLPVIQRQLGHSYVSTTSVYLQGIDVEEIIGTIRSRRAPMMHVSAGLEL